MDLIDWALVARSALWILGLSIVVAAWSYNSYLATARGEGHRVVFARPAFLLPFAIGMALFCAGMALGGANRLLERVLWVSLLGGFVYMAIGEARRANERKQDRQDLRDGQDG